MLRRELIKIGLSVVIGLALANYLFEQQYFPAFIFAIMPLYCIGSIYALEWMLRSSKKVLITYLQAQFVSILIRPMLGTFLSLFLLLAGFLFIFSFGWILGLIRCINIIVNA